MVSRFWKYMKNIRNIFSAYILNDKQKKEKKLTFLNHLLALDNVFSTKSEEQEVNLVWPNLFLIKMATSMYRWQNFKIDFIPLSIIIKR